MAERKYKRGTIDSPDGRTGTFAGSVIVHGGLILGAAAVTISARSPAAMRALHNFGEALGFIAVALTSIAVFLAFRSHGSMQFRGGMVAVWIGAVCMVAGRFVTNGNLAMVCAIAAIVFFVLGAAMFLLGTYRLQRAAR